MSTHLRLPIRVALLDDHAAIRGRFEAVVALEPDLQVVGFAANEPELWALLHQTSPEVLVLDMRYAGRGLELCLEIKRRPPTPAVVLYTGFASDSLVAGAALAGVGAVVCRSDPTTMLLDSIRALAFGRPPSVDRIAALLTGIPDV